jgi:hypothetical protein
MTDSNSGSATNAIYRSKKLAAIAAALERDVGLPVSDRD